VVKSNGDLERLAREQAALHRVATIVARGEPPSTVFAVRSSART
jgi:hypothetical protein